MENIKFIDAGIREMEVLIEGFYGNDGKTAYVMSSDHGMTDWGKLTTLLLAETAFILIDAHDLLRYLFYNI